jgi:hypothetical protein
MREKKWKNRLQNRIDLFTHNFVWILLSNYGLRGADSGYGRGGIDGRLGGCGPDCVVYVVVKGKPPTLK